MNDTLDGLAYANLVEGTANMGIDRDLLPQVREHLDAFTEACRRALRANLSPAALDRLAAATDAVEEARNSGDGTVSLGDIDELTEAARRVA